MPTSGRPPPPITFASGEHLVGSPRYSPIRLRSTRRLWTARGAVNIGPSLYGWYREHLTWHWMFWTSTLITLVMMLCIYYGIPKPAAAANKSAEAPSFAGFLYWSAGLAMLYAAIDQGERLDWWRSGLFNALFSAGSFFILCAIVRRLRMPNPLVAVPYLRQWNTILLGIGLFLFRFCLVTTIVLIPQSLAIHGFEATRSGPGSFGAPSL